MTVDVDIDVVELRAEIRRTYADVAAQPEKDFAFPTGRKWAADLDYPPELAHVPERAVESFAGVANPFSLGRLEPGERVLDVGCGAGTDSLVAAQMVGPHGHVTGIDMTREMLAKAHRAAQETGLSNGVIDLIPDKDAVFAEMFRVLATYMRSKFEEMRRKALKFGAHGATHKAYKPERSV